MKYVDEYRDAERCRALADQIRRGVSRRRTIMEVCGGQTHGLLSHGIEGQLADAVRLVHGPGCPVCVTPPEDIDFAIALSRRPEIILASFGDMLRVPGTRESLLQARAGGGDVRLVVSPLDAVELAREHTARQVVFFAVGFETTTPATALAVVQARELGLANFSLLVSHVCVLPAMEAIMAYDDCEVEGFLAAGHVCTVTGYADYLAFARRHCVPVVVTGFEPVDLLRGILDCVQQLELGSYDVRNRYARSVRPDGNHHARQCIDAVYEPCDRPWRGMGTIVRGGLCLRPAWRSFDARERFSTADVPEAVPTRCRSAEVLTGRIRPTDCECFAAECTPDTPLGAPMVSSEGACAAYFRYSRPRR